MYVCMYVCMYVEYVCMYVRELEDRFKAALQEGAAAQVNQLLAQVLQSGMYKIV